MFSKWTPCHVCDKEFFFAFDVFSGNDLLPDVAKPSPGGRFKNAYELLNLRTVTCEKNTYLSMHA